MYSDEDEYELYNGWIMALLISAILCYYKN